MFKKKMNFLDKKDKNAKAQELWQDYLSTKPSTRELGYLFYRDNKEELVELIWGEFTQRDDIKKNQLLEIVVSYKTPEWVKLEAWNLLDRFEIEEEDKERMTRALGSSHPISKEIEKLYGKNKEFFLEELEKVL